MGDFILKTVIGSRDISAAETRNLCGSRAGIFGIVCNLFLCALKIGVGILSASISIVADGLNNLADMGSSVITMIGFKIAGRPADKDHPYGHGRMEYMSAFIVAMLILLVGIELLKESAGALINGDAAPTYGIISIIILAVSVAVKLGMYFFNRALGKAINSEALLATAQDCVNDSLATFVILLGVAAGRIFELGFNLDAVMGIGVALFILYSGFMTAKETTDVILGMPPEKETIDKIKECIFSFGIFVGIHDLIVHNYGPNREFASVHVEVPQNIDIVYCHEIIDTCEKFVREQTGLSWLFIWTP